MQYLAWAGINPTFEDTFWTSKKVRDMIKNHFAVVVNRRNVFTGKLYKEDESIFAWDLYNVSCLHIISRMTVHISHLPQNSRIVNLLWFAEVLCMGAGASLPSISDRDWLPWSSHRILLRSVCLHEEH